MKNNDASLLPLLFAFVFLGLNNNTYAQTFINPYIGYGVTSLNYPITLRPFSVYQEFSHKRLYSPSIYLGFSIKKSINEYWGIDFQSDISYQKFSIKDHSFLGSTGSYFWQFRNSVIPNLNIGKKWRSGIGFNIDYLIPNHSLYRDIRKRVDFGSILQIDYQLNNHFNLNLNYRRAFKVINVDWAGYEALESLQSLNLSFGYRFRIRNKKDKQNL